jgi:hypothetical protein
MTSTILMTAALTVFAWTAETGTPSFTDDPARIPAKHTDDWHSRTVNGFEGHDRITELTTPAPAPVTVIPEPAPAAKEDCGEIRVRSERRNVKTNSGGSNARFFIAEDDCEVLFDAPYYPDLNSLRASR